MEKNNGEERKKHQNSKLQCQKNTLDNYFTRKKVVQTQDTDPMLIEDDEVEIQLRSPKKRKDTESKEQIENDFSKDRILEDLTDDKILYKDEEDEIQFQPPKKIKKQGSFRESKIVESCSFTEVDHRMSIGGRLSKPGKAEFFTLESFETKTQSQSITETTDQEETSSESQKRIRGACVLLSKVLCFEKFRQHDSDKKSNERTKDMEVSPRELGHIGNAELFISLDREISIWDSTTLLCVLDFLSLEHYFRGDVLRLLFYYILNGPDENVMFGMKDVLLSHFKLHPPDLEALRLSYRNLLYESYIGKDYEFPKNITDDGIWYYLIEKFGKLYKLGFGEEPEPESDEKEEVNSEEPIEPVTFELLEKRYNNFEPLLEKEYQRMLKMNHAIKNFNWNKEEDLTLKRPEELKRLNVALKLITHLLQQDFHRCVSRLKQPINEDKSDQEEIIPLIKYLTNEGWYSKLLKLYFKTNDEELWILLSQLFELMAEQTRIFYSDNTDKSRWLFPFVDDKKCIKFADEFFSLLKTNTWFPDEELRRLRMLGPPWFQQRVITTLVSHRLNLKVSFDLEGIANLLHSKIENGRNEDLSTSNRLTINPCEVVLSETDSSANTRRSQRLLKKRNQYGESHLHQLCKEKKADLAELKRFLSVPGVDLNAVDNYGWSPLHEAVNSPSQATEKTRLLLQHHLFIDQKPVDVGAQNMEGVTPLHEAVSNGNLDICRLLLERGGYSLLFKHDCKGITPLDLAKENPEISQYFKQTVEAKETLDLTSESILHLENQSIELLKIACDASMANLDTMELQKILKTDEGLLNVSTVDEIVCDIDVLLLYEKDQNQFFKFRKLLQNLSRNESNPESILIWNDLINPTTLEIEQEKSVFQTRYEGLDLKLFDDSEEGDHGEG